MTKALLVLGLQNYFVKDRAIDLPKKIAWHIRESDYDHVLFVNFYNDSNSNFRRLIGFTDVTEAPDTEIHPDLMEFVNDKNVFFKNTYSALKAKNLNKYLEEHNTKVLELCGINLDAGVLATAFEAFDLGYEVKILENLCSVASVRDDIYDAAKIIIKRNLERKEF